MDIQIKKLNYQPSLSEETPCFRCEVWENGKKIADVSNNGQGGCNRVLAFNNASTAHIETLDAEAHIFGLVYELHDVKRLQSKGFVVKKGDKMFSSKFPMAITKMKAATNWNAWLQKEVARIKSEGYTILNTNLGI